MQRLDRRVVLLAIDRPDLEDAQLRNSLGQVARRHLQQRGPQRRTKMRVDFAERIGQRERGVPARKAALDQRVGDAFVPAAIGQQVTHPADAMMRAVRSRLRLRRG